MSKEFIKSSMLYGEEMETLFFHQKLGKRQISTGFSAWQETAARAIRRQQVIQQLEKKNT